MEVIFCFYQTKVVQVEMANSAKAHLQYYVIFTRVVYKVWRQLSLHYGKFTIIFMDKNFESGDDSFDI